MSQQQQKQIRCAIYTRVSTDENLGQDFNSIDNQRECAESFIASQQGEGWVCLPKHYVDGGYTGGNLERPALKELLTDVEAGEIDIVLVYKVDRLTRSIADFGKIVDVFEQHGVSFVSVTQQINTSTSMGRLMLNVLLSFAQFERELVSERTRDKIAASRRKGMWTGGRPILGYDIERLPGSSKLVVNPDEAEIVREIFALYLKHSGLVKVVGILNERNITTKRWTTKAGRAMGGHRWDKGKLYALLTNVTYRGLIRHHDKTYDGLHVAIVDKDTWTTVQSVLQHNGATGGYQSRNKHGALLREILFCGSCERAMSHAFSKRDTKMYRYYVCGRAQKEGWHTCPTKSVPAQEIEDYIVNQIRSIGQDTELCTQTIEQIRARAETARNDLCAEQSRLQRQLKNDHEILSSAADDTYRSELHERISGTERRLTAIDTELQQLEASLPTTDQIADAMINFDAVWEVLSAPERVKLIRLLVEKIVYDGDLGTIEITYRPTAITSLQAQLERQLEAAA